MSHEEEAREMADRLAEQATEAQPEPFFDELSGRWIA